MINGERLIDRPLRWGMVGGGRTGQVGYKHRTGALRDGSYQLICGAFDLDVARGRDFGVKLGVAPERCYDDYKALIAAESQRPDGVEVVSIATPNFTHYEITKACLEAGLHVICEKPLFFTVAECDEIAKLAEEKGLIVGVTYGFSGHPLLHQMAAMVKKGILGDIRIVDMQYTHGFSSGDDANASDAQKWRTNPATSGPTFVLGDIGTHIYYMSQIVLPHMKIEKLLCDRQSFIRSRAPLEDNAYVLSHYDNGAVGRLWVSSVNAGSMASQRFRFVGSKASVEWTDTQPNELIYEVQGQPPQVLHHGMPYLEDESLRYERMGALHTEGLGDSWSNIYLWIAQAIDAKKRGDGAFLRDHHYPGIKAGTDGVRWLENCVRSADAGSVWVRFE
ncbi:Gfo/Idh/MocA family oxidoreductase [Agrobacterium sp. SHOUNA12C]|uniref:Oxidoreductase n=1 Tax=Rhizobium rhizogenes NBRC 13257 TaxID=1220581 RepID=A0AA87U562_RHIRH|nr:Gfo/Idh/MocA family oxidoreductase [Rhizobium rhizogenes]MCJ9720642.1 Gfo/Idh/MocA family oxidoreductase [Agrobacterium sp. BETTINA12B]MCJ9757296.1 Gfo/Idh/MocA family oxidoreductase [Agrobacterium sp. SHOUNA12C]NTF51364.1 Gfo/Idh/MocA family oxidoreductase [Rhizobium rhizogenes]NTF57898.1 Gfo/Idh/MocA family oxidoreductase [Rhizobium rhizogenes]NTF64317.1 Gfo/Idh/MocA family oxidoreductase [Rhizobium rhizogenes]